jgi:hypothetical protein
MLNKIRNVLDAQGRVDEEYAEDMGYDAGKNGPNGTNTHFAIFSRPQFTKAWERGKARADAEKRSGDGEHSS